MATFITAQLVSEQWIKDNLPVGKDVSIEDLKPFIFQAQDFQAQETLGSELYKRLMEGVAANDLNSDETTLIKLIRPAIAYYVLWNALPFMNWKLTAKAVMVGTADTAQPAGVPEVNMLRGYFKSTAEWYAEQVRKYLAMHSQLYPQYSTNINEDIIPNQRNAYGAANAIYMEGFDFAKWRQYYGKDPQNT